MADKYVPIFFDWIEATQELKAQEKGRLIDAIVLYARGGDWSELLEGNERYVFPMFQLQIDRAKKVSIKRAESGSMGGKQTEAKSSKSKQTEANRSKHSNKNKEEYEYEYKHEEENKKEREGTRATRFTPPTVEEVSGYAAEKGWTDQQFSAQRFVDFYASKGWIVGKNPMKDWKAAARGWVSRDGTHAKTAWKEKGGARNAVAGRRTFEPPRPIFSEDEIL